MSKIVSKGFQPKCLEKKLDGKNVSGVFIPEINAEGYYSSFKLFLS
jgi:hypothetical protein